MAVDKKLSSFRAEITVNGDVIAADRIKGLGRRGMMTLGLMERIKELLFMQQQARLASAPWAPLQDVTIMRKLATGEDPTIFRDEWRQIGGNATRVGNALWFSLTMDGAANQVKRSTRTTAVFGSTLFYAPFVQNVKGTKRKILGISTSDALEITEAVGHYLVQGSDTI